MTSFWQGLAFARAPPCQSGVFYYKMRHKQLSLFENSSIEKNHKTYRAIRHDIVRIKQSKNIDLVHHPAEKIKQARSVLNNVAGWGDLSILELFAGHGNMTKVYADYGEVIAHEHNKKVFKKLVENTQNSMLVRCLNVDSYTEFHHLIYLKQKFDVVDIDSYGFPSRFMPDIFLLINYGILFITMPKPYVNILNGITATHLTAYFGESNPSKEKIIEKFVLYGLCHWRKVELIDCIDCKSIWRMAFMVTKVKATDYTGVKNK